MLHQGIVVGGQPHRVVLGGAVSIGDDEDFTQGEGHALAQLVLAEEYRFPPSLYPRLLEVVLRIFSPFLQQLLDTPSGIGGRNSLLPAKPFPEPHFLQLADLFQGGPKGGLGEKPGGVIRPWTLALTAVRSTCLDTDSNQQKKENCFYPFPCHGKTPPLIAQLPES